MIPRSSATAVRPLRLASLLGVSLAASAALAGPITITPIVLELDFYGFPISSGFSASEAHAVNNSGRWLVESDTTNPDTEADGLVLTGTGHALPGTVLLSEGQALPLPAGATIDSFDSITVNAAGNSAFNFFLSGTAGGSFDSGVFYNTALLIQESTLSTAPGLSPGTPYIGWFDVRLNDSDQILMLASVDDPAIATTVDRALVLINNPAGAFTETLIAKEGDQLLPGRLVADFSTGPHSIALRNNSRVLFIADLDGDTLTDGAVFHHDGSVTTLLAQEGSPSAVTGRTWGTLLGTAIDVNNSGQWVMRGDLDGATTDDSLIVRNGTEVVAREGSPVPAALGPYAFTSFGTGGVAIADNGDVFYVASWNDPDTTRNTGIFVNGELLVQKGVTPVAGQTLSAISTVQDNLSVSPSGQWIVFEGTLADGRDGAFLIERPADACPADFNNSGTVTTSDISAFLTAWFADIVNGTTNADFNHSGSTTTADISAFLSAWFAAVQQGC